MLEGEEFDAHPDLLNVRNGVVDLRDGTLRPHDPQLLLHQGDDGRLPYPARPTRTGSRR